MDMEPTEVPIHRPQGHTSSFGAAKPRLLPDPTPAVAEQPFATSGRPGLSLVCRSTELGQVTSSPSPSPSTPEHSFEQHHATSPAV